MEGLGGRESSHNRRLTLFFGFPGIASKGQKGKGNLERDDM